MKKMLFVGIDISADELVVAVERDGELLPVTSFENDTPGHRKLIRWLTKSRRPVRVCLEATGVYGFDLSLALHRTKGVEVMVANPRAIKDFAGAFLQRSKTDALDAVVLLEFVKRMPFQVWQAPPVEIQQLRAVSRRITALTKNMAMEKNRLHASDHSEELTKFTRDDIASHVEYLAQSIRRLGEEAVAMIRQSPELSREIRSSRLGEGHCASQRDPDPCRARRAPGRHDLAAVGCARRIRSAAARFGNLDPQAGPCQQGRQQVLTLRALHACAGCRPPRAQRASVLREADRAWQEAAASHRGRDAQTAPRDLRNASQQSRLRGRKILCDGSLTEKRVSNG